eukprot:scaffold116353_cov66-Phaeocystis_antarctica.AAC.8
MRSQEASKPSMSGKTAYFVPMLCLSCLDFNRLAPTHARRSRHSPTFPLHVPTNLDPLRAKERLCGRIMAAVDQ